MYHLLIIDSCSLVTRNVLAMNLSANVVHPAGSRTNVRIQPRLSLNVGPNWPNVRLVNLASKSM